MNFATMSLPPCPRCGGYDCDVDDEGVCQGSLITEDEIRRDCDAQRPELTETFVSLWRQGRVNVMRGLKGRLLWSAKRN